MLHSDEIHLLGAHFYHIM